MKQVAIVTGASRGIGFAIAKQLAEDGFCVVVSARSPEQDNRENMAELARITPEYFYVQADVSRQADRENLIRQAVGRFGAVHLLVNNAGVAPKVRSDLLDMTEESFDYVLGVNTKGALFLSQLAAKQMLTQPIGKNGRRGTIVNITSCSAAAVSVNRGEYCVSKAGASMVTQLFADRLAAENIAVHEVRPGVIATDMTKGVQEKYDRMMAEGVFPQARWGTPQDVALAVSALAGKYFPYSTGGHIDVDGGFHLRRL